MQQEIQKAAEASEKKLQTDQDKRREIARLSLHRLVTDGRIHPARIEEVVRKTRKQIESTSQSTKH